MAICLRYLLSQRESQNLSCPTITFLVVFPAKKQSFVIRFAWYNLWKRAHFLPFTVCILFFSRCALTVNVYEKNWDNKDMDK